MINQKFFTLWKMSKRSDVVMGFFLKRENAQKLKKKLQTEDKKNFYSIKESKFSDFDS